ncbi:MAG TPA: ACP S-malonyltransferase [Nevskiales bacterium]|nr:ACP S-malonyltransferase [Nevskiales bacterium]
MRFALLFPGQGSQSVGMLGALAARHAVVRETFAEASAALSYDLWQLVSEGPADMLDRTEHTQPALLAAGVAVWRTWRALGGPEPDAMAGHSLGEYTALVCASALSFADALRLVERRGQLMQAAVPAGSGAMAAIVGLDDEQVRAVCAESAQGEVVEAVNFNAPGQVVVAGHHTAVERAATLAKARGAKLTKVLPVSVPSHCSLMRPAAEQLAQDLQAVAVQPPAIPVLHNLDATPRSRPEDIRAALVAQLHSPVQWVKTIQALRAQGAAALLECGPGRVLTGLTKRIDKAANGECLQDPQTLEAGLALVRGS